MDSNDPVLTPYRDIVESAAGVCCPNIFGIRVPNNGAILTAAIGHQVIQVALPRHVQEIDAIYKKNNQIPRSKVAKSEGKPWRRIKSLRCPTLTNVKARDAKKAGAVRQRLGVVRIRSLRTMSSPALVWQRAAE